MSSTLTWNRRVLLRNLALCAAAAPLRVARAAPTAPRALVNVVVSGGWDSFWSHNAVSSSEAAGHIASFGAIVEQGAFVNPPGGANGSQGILEPTRVLTNDSPAGWPFHLRCPDNFLRPHPHQASTLLGPGFIDFSAADLSSVTVWRGIKAEGGHFTGNRVLQTGATGDQTSSFPALVALELADRQGLMPLHYTQLSTTRSLLYNQNGPISLAEPVMLPDFPAWQALTGPSARELPPVRRAFLDATLERMAGTSRLRLASNRAAYEAFSASHRGSVDLMASGFASGADFQAAVTAYRNALTGLSSHVFAQWFPRAILAVSHRDTLAFRFALAEFLVTHRLAAVVDLPGIVCDFHQQNDDDAMVTLAHLTCLKVLNARLKAFPEPEGGTAFDRTTVVMHTEMERSPTLMPNIKLPGRSGTQHWDLMTSVLLSGAGVSLGRVVGEFSRPAGTYASANFNVRHFSPLPIDLSTGQVATGGTVPTIRSLFSTMLEVFGATSRSQLKVMAPVIRALMR